MVNPASGFTPYRTILDDAEKFYTANLTAFNSSGASGQALFAIDTETNTLNVVVTAKGLAPGEAHVQHIHGGFLGDSGPADTVSPTLRNDANADGFVEVLEGVPSYGDILLPLDDTDNDDETNDTPAAPIADAEGNVLYFETFDLNDNSNFFRPVTGANYTAKDIMPPFLRRYVIMASTCLRDTEPEPMVRSRASRTAMSQSCRQPRVGSSRSPEAHHHFSSNPEMWHAHQY